jgi:hypothetical protein
MSIEFTGRTKKTTRVARIKTASRRLPLLVALVALSAGSFIAGCVGSVSGASSSNPQALALQFTPANLNFGSVPAGTKLSRGASVANMGAGPATITQIRFSSNQFTVSGLTFPMTLAAGQIANFTVWFNGTTSGKTAGTLTFEGANGTSSMVQLAMAATVPAVQPQLTISPAAVDAGSAQVGSKTTSNVTLSNIGNADLTVSAMTVNGAAFSIAGIATPKVISAGQSAVLSIIHAPTATGTDSGSISIISNDPASPATISLTGSGTSVPVGHLTLNPSILAFGNVVVGGSGVLSATVTNSGQAVVHISSIIALGSGFSQAGLATPATLAVGQSAQIQVTYAPTSAGLVGGTVAITSDAPGLAPGLSLSGTGVQAAISVSPASLSFGSLVDGQSKSQPVLITNTGSANLNITQLSSSGAGVSVSGLTTPLTIAAGQSSTFTVQFAPQTPGNTSGTISLASNAPNSPASLAVSGTGVAATSTLSVSPASVSFTNVTGNTSTQQMQINNTGNVSLTISQANVTGTGFSATGLSLPLTIAAGQSSSFSVQFAAQSAGNFSGSLTLASNAANSLATVVLSGSASAATETLAISPMSMSFGSVSLGSAPAQTLTLTNTGNANVTISQINASGAGFTLSGAGVPITLSPSQSIPVSVAFDPSAVGAVSGNVSVVSNATGSPAGVALSGTGVSQVQHSVQLNWTSSSSTVAGYNVYRTATSGSGYSLVSGSLVSLDSFSDSAVQSGQTYYYVATAVDGSGNESSYSNEAQAIVP